MQWIDQSFKTILADIAEEYVEQVGQKEDLPYYLEMLDHPGLREGSGLWPYFSEFACEVLKRMLEERPKN